MGWLLFKKNSTDIVDGLVKFESFVGHAIHKTINKEQIRFLFDRASSIR